MNNTVCDKKKLEFRRYLLLRLYSHVTYSTEGSVAIRKFQRKLCSLNIVQQFLKVYVTYRF